MRECTACSTTTDDDTGRFCPECGAVLVPSTPVIDLTPSMRADPNRETAVPTVASDEPSGSSSLVGQTLDDQFVIDAVLGGGSFATVYRGRQIGLDRLVAVKVPTHEIAADPLMSKRFAREARAAAKIVHPGVVTIYAVGDLPDGRPYLAMQLIDGEPLDKILADGPIDPLRALSIARDVAAALSETHAQDVVHRDLKPTNIVWRRDRNGDDRITLVDFGIAVCKPGNADATRLTAGGLIGTPHYMSPEQAHGEVVDARSDLYSLGCVLFELVTGEPPFDGSGFEVLLAHLGRPAPVPSGRKPGLPPVVDRLIAALLAKKPAERCASADALVGQLDDAIAELEGRRDAPSSRPSRPPRRRTSPTWLDRPPPPRRARWLIGLTVGVAALAAAGFTALRLSQNEHTVVADDGSPTSDADQPARRVYSADDGSLTMKVTAPDPIIARAETSIRLEIWNKLGQPIEEKDLVVTIEDPKGVARGFTASSRRSAGTFGFRYRFPQSGPYVVHVFPSAGDARLDVTLDVAK
jgi:serine/threonine protein kinase